MCHSNVSYCSLVLVISLSLAHSIILQLRGSGIMESIDKTHIMMESLHFVCIYVFEIFVLMLHQEFLTCGFFFLCNT